MDEVRYVGTCPKCGMRVIDAGKMYVCEKNVREKKDNKWVQAGECSWMVWKNFRGGRINLPHIEKLLSGEAVELECKTRDGEAYTAAFELAGDDKQPMPVRKAIATCPACGGRIVERTKQYACENSRMEKDASGEWRAVGSCEARCPKTVCGRDVTAEEAAALLAGETCKFDGMVSSKGNDFDAWVRLDPAAGWRLVFSFDEQPPAAEKTSETEEENSVSMQENTVEGTEDVPFDEGYYEV